MPNNSGSTGTVAKVVRTCIGCRERADKTALVRLVAVKEDTTSVVVPDPDGSLPGRGAHLHPTTRCLEWAISRKAFGRAFRTQGTFDIDAVRDLVGPEPREEPRIMKIPDPNTEHPLMDHR